MKKILFFAIALVASAMVFTACEKNNANALVGTWSRDTQKDASGYYETMTLIFNNDNGFVFQGQQHYPQNPDAIAIMILEGKYEINGDIATVHYQKHGWNHGEGAEYIPDWEGYDEKIKFSIDGKKLTIIRNYGEEYQNDPEVYTKQ